MGASLRFIGLAASLGAISLLAAPTAAHATAEATVFGKSGTNDSEFSPGSDFVSAELSGGGFSGAGSFSFVSSAFANPRRGSIGGATTAGNVGATGEPFAIRTFSAFNGSVAFSGTGTVLIRLSVIGSLTGSQPNATGVRAILSTGGGSTNIGDVQCCFFGGGTSMNIREGRIISRDAFNNQFELENVLGVTPGVPVTIGASLSTRAQPALPTGTASVLYGHTAQVQIFMPVGMTFRSLSGDFLSDLIPRPPSAVPEPASWMMMIAGFGLVSGMLRLRRRHQSAVLG